MFRELMSGPIGLLSFFKQVKMIIADWDAAFQVLVLYQRTDTQIYIYSNDLTPS